MTTEPAPRPAPALRAVALFEAFKGAVVLLAASGVLALMHHDLHALAAAFIEHFHLDPASRYPRIFLDAAEHAQNIRLWWLAAGAALYAALRFIEAWGLYTAQPWAEMLAAASGALYVPFEVAGLVREPTWHGAALLLVNAGIVALMVRALRARRTRAAAAPGMATE